MTQVTPTRTTTTVVNSVTDNLTIICEPNVNDDGTLSPSIFKSTVANEAIQIDNVNAIEGELIFSSEINSGGELLKDGSISIYTSENDAEHYSVDQTQGRLMYEE